MAINQRHCRKFLNFREQTKFRFQLENTKKAINSSELFAFFAEGGGFEPPVR